MFDYDDSPEPPEIGDFLPEGVGEERLNALVIEVVGDLEKIGLYQEETRVLVPPSPGLPVMFHGRFTARKVAFTQRVLDPVAFEEANQIRDLDPTLESDIEDSQRQNAIDTIQSWLHPDEP